MLKNSLIKILTVALVVMLMLASVIAFYSYGVQDVDATEAVGRASNSKIYNFLVLGKDNAAGLCDVMMLISINTQTKDVNIMQIPRDTYFNYTDKSYKKINGAPRALGTDGFVKSFSECLGIKIDNYLAFDLDDVRDIVDYIGGVTVCVPQDMSYDDPEQGLSIHFKAGEQTLNGSQAVEFLRYRSGYITGDLGRIDAQKLFLNSFADRVAGLGNPFAYIKLFKFVLSRCETDINEKDIFSLAMNTSEKKEGRAYYMTAPGEAVQSDVSGAWYYILSRSSMLEILRERFGCAADENAFDNDKDNKFVDKQIKRFYDIYNAHCEYKVYSADEIGNNEIDIN